MPAPASIQRPLQPEASPRPAPFRARWHRSLAAKLLLAIVPVLAGGTLLSLWALEPVLEAALRGGMEAEITAMGETLKVALEQQMLRQAPGFVQAAVDEVGATGLVKRILIIGTTGRVVHAFPREEKGRLFDRKHDRPCAACHAGPQRPSARTFLLPATEAGEQTFVMATPLLNRPACQRCHGAEQRLNGMLLVERDARSAAATSASIRSLLLESSAVTIAGLALTVAGVVAFAVHRPVRRLIAGARRIGAGDLDARVEVEGGGEVAELAATLNEMAASLRSSLTEVRHRNQELTVLYALVLRLSKTVPLEDLKPLVLQLLLEVLGAQRAWLVSAGQEAGSVEILEQAPGDREPTRHALAAGDAPRACCGVPADLVERWSDSALGAPARSAAGDLLILPLRAHGRAIGLAVALAGDPGAPARQSGEDRFLATVAAHVSVALDNARLYTLAITDELTGLFSLRYFRLVLHDAVARETRYGDPVSLILIDLDHFKRVNDTHGHPAGDAVLKEVARRIRATLRQVDVAARYGGEELAAVLQHTGPEGARIVAERLRAAIGGAPFAIEGLAEPLTVTASLGVASCPGDARTMSGLIGRTDEALYRAKGGGRNRVAIAAPAEGHR